jgi:hypothetical protein
LSLNQLRTQLVYIARHGKAKWKFRLMSASKSLALSLIASLLSTILASAQALHDYRVGPQSNGSFVVPTNQTVSPAGRQITFNGRPLAISINPSQKTAAVLNTGSGQSNLPTSPIVIVDLLAGSVKQEFNPGNNHASYDGVIYSGLSLSPTFLATAPWLLTLKSSFIPMLGLLITEGWPFRPIRKRFTLS